MANREVGILNGIAFLPVKPIKIMTRETIPIIGDSNVWKNIWPPMTE